MLLIELPWNRTTDDESATGADSTAGDGDPRADSTVAGRSRADAAVVCEFQDGTLAMFEEEVRIQRARRSKFEDTVVPLADVTGVEYDGGITVGYLQIQRRGVEPDAAGLLSDPVDETTLHFTRGDRDCAREARDAIVERSGAPAETGGRQ